MTRSPRPRRWPPTTRLQGPSTSSWRRARTCRRQSSPRRRSRSCGTSSVVRRTPQPLDAAAAALSLEALLDRRLRRPRRASWTRNPERLAQLLDEPLGRELAVAPLAALVLRDRPEHRAGLGHGAPLLRVRERGGGLDVEDRLDP